MDYFGLFPFLFILLSSGVISGCNSLVSSGTTVKQLDQECKAPLIGGGAKLLQGSLALFVLIILAVGFSPLEERGFFYLDSLEGSSLLRILSAFVEGMATFIGALGIPPEYGLALGAMVALSFTVSTLDTTTRILRYLLCEMASPYGFQPLTNRYGATFLALLPAFSLILLMEGDGFFSLFFLFGSTNQILAGLVFFIGSLYLSYQCKPLRYTLVPMFFLFIIAGFSLLMNINIWVAKGDLFLTIAGGILFLLEIWLILEAISVFRRLSLEEMLPFNF